MLSFTLWGRPFAHCTPQSAQIPPPRRPHLPDSFQGFDTLGLPQSHLPSLLRPSWALSPSFRVTSCLPGLSSFNETQADTPIPIHELETPGSVPLRPTERGPMSQFCPTAGSLPAPAPSPQSPLLPCLPTARKRCGAGSQKGPHGLPSVPSPH